MNNSKIIQSIVDEHIDQIFGDIVDSFELESGDISPSQLQQLELTKLQLRSLMATFVASNKRPMRREE